MGFLAHVDDGAELALTIAKAAMRLCVRVFRVEDGDQGIAAGPDFLDLLADTSGSLGGSAIRLRSLVVMERSLRLVW